MSSEDNAIKRVKNGDAASFEVLVAAYEQRLFVLARNLVGDPAEALDIVQETFLSAYSAIAGFDPAKGRFSTWLYAIARNKCLNARAKAGVAATEADPDAMAGGHDVERLCGEREFFDRLDSALAGLPKRDRAVFVLAEIQELSLAEVAEIENVPLGTVKSRLSRTRRKLRRLLGAYAG